MHRLLRQLPAVLINEVSTMGPNGPLDEAIEIINTTGEQVDPLGGPLTPAPANNVGSTLVLTGAEFSGTTSTPNVLRCDSPVPKASRPTVAWRCSAAWPRRPSRSTVSHSRRRWPPPRKASMPSENQRTAQLAGSNTCNLLNHDTKNNQRAFSLQVRTF